MNARQPDLRSGAILFTDLVGFTAYTDVHGDRSAVEVLDRQADLATAALDGRGRIVKELGDGLMVWFDDATEALRMGLISRVVPHERLREEAIAAAESILRTAPEARLHVKRIIHERYGHVDRMSMDWSIFRGPEAREGMRAFAEKRSPSWIPKALRTGKRA